MLLDDLHDRLAARPRLCAMGLILTQANEAERQALDLCIEKIQADRDLPQHQRVFTITWLVSVLNKNGLTIGKTAVSDHISGGCICVK